MLYSATHVGCSGKYRKTHKLEIHKLNTTQKSKRHKIQQNKTSAIQLAFTDTRPGNKVGLFYNAPEHTIKTNKTDQVP